MVKCPKCKKEIDILRHWQEGTNVYDCWLEGKRMDYQHDEFHAAHEQGYECPKCGKEIAQSEADAIEFLKGANK